MKRFALAGTLVLVFAGLCSQAQAQTGTGRGRVVDDKGQPMADVKIEVDFQGGVNRKLETKTNKKGEYIQVGLQPGVYRFTATKDGYVGAYAEQKIGLGDATEVPELKLVPKAVAQAAAGGGGPTADEIKEAYRKATELLRAQKWDEAEAALKAIQAQSAEIPEVYNNLGYVYAQKKDVAASQAAYEKAIELRPTYGDAYLGLAQLYQDQGQTDKAIELLAKAAAANPDDPTAQLNQGIFYFNAQKYAEAEAAFKKVAALDASNVEVQYYLGIVAINEGKTDEAVAFLEKYLASSPTNTQNATKAKQLVDALKKK